MDTSLWEPPGYSVSEAGNGHYGDSMNTDTRTSVGLG